MSDLAEIAGMQHPGHAIRDRRTALGWTQADLAERADVAQADISRIEKVDSMPGGQRFNGSLLRRCHHPTSRSEVSPTLIAVVEHRGDSEYDMGVEGQFLIVASLD
jgi:transcriptional regulator with XRE-family HTH domain